MPRGKKELAEQIIPKLREVEVEVGRGKTVAESVKKIGVTDDAERKKPQAVGYTGCGGRLSTVPAISLIA